MTKRLLVTTLATLLLGCGGDGEDEVTGNKANWPAGWKVYDEHLVDPSFQNSSELEWHNCDQSCYWTGIFECPSEELNYVAAGFEAGVDCDFDFYGDVFGEPDLVPLDSGKVLFKFSERTIYELSLDGSPGKKVGAIPPGFMESEDLREVQAIHYHELERTPGGDVYALAFVDLYTDTAIYSAYVIVALEGADFAPRLIAQLTFEKSPTDIITNFNLSPDLNEAWVLQHDGTLNGDLHRINLDTGAVVTVPEGEHGYTSQSMLSLSGRGYTTQETSADSDTFLVEVDMETGAENPIPFPDISEEDWYTVAGRHLVQGTVRHEDGYLTLQSRANGEQRHLWIDAQGNATPLHDEYVDPTLGLMSNPFLMNGTLYAIASFKGATYTREGLWYMDAPQLP